VTTTRLWAGITSSAATATVTTDENRARRRYVRTGCKAVLSICPATCLTLRSPCPDRGDHRCPLWALITRYIWQNTHGNTTPPPP
jgi:hypothetical protein